MENNEIKYTTFDIADKILYAGTGLKFCKKKDLLPVFSGEYNLTTLQDDEGNKNLYYVAVDDYKLLFSYAVVDTEGEKFEVQDLSNELRVANLCMYGKEYKRSLLTYIDRRDKVALEDFDQEEFELCQKIAELNQKLMQLKADKRMKTLESMDEYAYWSGIELEEENIKVD